MDLILSDSHIVALFDWKKREELYKRIDQYINVDRLRPMLDSALTGLKNSLYYINQDASKYFQWPGKRLRKEASAESLSALIIETTQFMESLSGAMAFSSDNYVGPSGINMEELTDIKHLLVESDKNVNEDDRKASIIKLVDSCQAKRHKQGMCLLTQVSDAIHKLSIAFGLEIEA
ncbi:hypothetical protein MNBD_GAMMA12-2595 [hydrothermal vent metagenome]|uniref:Uncharacterized protein n=1 Tax=hydrothermal vent metagenome TaxID=652676 RepID=A0A3B0Z665_9ZZZZ